MDGKYLDKFLLSARRPKKKTGKKSFRAHWLVRLCEIHSVNQVTHYADECCIAGSMARRVEARAAKHWSRYIPLFASGSFGERKCIMRTYHTKATNQKNIQYVRSTSARSRSIAAPQNKRRRKSDSVQRIIWDCSTRLLQYHFSSWSISFFIHLSYEPSYGRRWHLHVELSMNHVSICNDRTIAFLPLRNCSSVLSTYARSTMLASFIITRLFIDFECAALVIRYTACLTMWTVNTEPRNLQLECKWEIHLKSLSHIFCGH